MGHCFLRFLPAHFPSATVCSFSAKQKYPKNAKYLLSTSVSFSTQVCKFSTKTNK